MTAEKRALIVKVDGVDGSGKTTLVDGLAGVYKDRFSVVTTREFGSLQDHNVIGSRDAGTVSRLLYEMSLNPRLEFDDIDRQLAMALACRRQNRLVLPKLRQSYDLIFSDRSSLTGFAYGYHLGVELRRLLKWVVEPILEEDSILWIDIDPQIAFNRHRKSQNFVLEEIPVHAVEQKGLAFQTAVAKQFAELTKGRQDIIRLDGFLNSDALLSVAVSYVDRLLAGMQK